VSQPAPGATALTVPNSPATEVALPSEKQRHVGNGHVATATRGFVMQSTGQYFCSNCPNGAACNNGAGSLSADVGFVTPRDAAHAAEIVAEIRALEASTGREDRAVHIFGDLVVFLDETKAAAAARRQRLDEWAGTEFHSDAQIFAGTAIGLADLLQEWHDAGLSGFRLRPAALPHDLTQITDRLVPELRRRCLFRTRYEADTLRGLLGLGRPANRYAAA